MPVNLYMCLDKHLLLTVFILFIGFLTEKLLLYRLGKLASKRGWNWGELLVNSLRFMPTLWSLLLVLHIASEVLWLPRSLLNLKDKLLWLFLILSFSIFLSRLAGGFVILYMKSYREDMPATSLISQMTRVVILIIGVVVALDKVGIAITPLVTAFGIGGLAVALAIRDTLENLFAGFYILATKKIKPGDYIRLQSGEEGFVEDITWRNTILRQPANNLLIVPNSRLSTSIILNYQMPTPELSLIVPVNVSYDNDIEKVEHLTLQVAKEVQREVEGAVPEFEPKVRFTGFGDFSLNFNVILRAKDFESQSIVRHEFIKRLKNVYDREGIKIAVPTTGLLR